MKYTIFSLLASICAIGATEDRKLANRKQHTLGLDSVSRGRCDLPRKVDPSHDGLESSEKLFSGDEAIKIMVERHQPLVQIESICYDDLGDFDDDERWSPFKDIPKTLEQAYPYVYKYATVETVNQYGLVYTIQGSDESLAPVLLTAHQDVVPVEEETLDEWHYPPFSATYNDTNGFIYGRGASEKAGITAMMSAMEALLSQEAYNPTRTVIFAFGFDEECSGSRGAGQISEHLKQQYGENGIAVILDEGGAGLQTIGDTMYALPAVYEKGYLDVWFDIDVVGGHAGKPAPHTGIGIMSDIVINLENNPFKPEIIKNSPAHQALECFVQFSPNALPELTRAVRWGDLRTAAYILSQVSVDTQYFIQTSQAVDVISGGGKINSLPEFVTLGVNHRVAPQDNIGGVQWRIAQLGKNIARKYNLRLEAFEDDEDYQQYLISQGIRPHKEDTQSRERGYQGTLRLNTKRKSYTTPVSPTSGPFWDLLVGTIRHTFSDRARNVVAAPGTMTGNTDTRHYLNLSKNIYRWSPGSLRSFSNINTVNERLLMSEHVDMAKFYYDFIRNFDQAQSFDTKTDRKDL